MPTPPRLALRLLAWRVPEPDREYFVGDLVEAFHGHAATRGLTSARRWFWRETFLATTTRWPRVAAIPDERSPETSMTSPLHALRLALRSLGRSPALTGLVVATLGLGIGATTSVYSVARAALFAKPPFPESDRLALVFEQDMVNLPHVQTGMRASGTGTVEFSNYMESRLRYHHQLIDRFIAEGEAKKARKGKTKG